MTEIRATRRLDGGANLHGIPPWCVALLSELDALLGPNQTERVKQRLCPDPTDDPEANREWERLVHPDLFALVASSRQIVRADLKNLEVDPDLSGNCRLSIRGEHMSAWIHALNTARLSISEHNQLKVEHLDGELDLEHPLMAAVARVHALGWLQQLLIECSMPESEEEDELEFPPEFDC